MTLIGLITILYVMFAHLIADFVMQTQEMALNKATSIYWLTRHVLSYMKTFFAFAILLVGGAIICGFDCTYIPESIVYYIFLNSGLHWITDYFTSKQTKKYFGKQDYHNGFVVVGIDQFIHITCLLTSLWWLFF